MCKHTFPGAHASSALPGCPQVAKWVNWMAGLTVWRAEDGHHLTESQRGAPSFASAELVPVGPCPESGTLQAFGHCLPNK